jgi:hypothetical protein
VSAFTELLIEQGASFSTTVDVKDAAKAAVNLYSYTASSRMSKSYYSTSNTIITSTITGNANGEITLSMTAANTANLTPGRQVFDLLITNTSTGIKTRVVEGIIIISPGVTS